MPWRAWTVASFALLCLVLAHPCPAASANHPPLSEATEECLSCHSLFTPGITRDWRHSRHAANTVELGLQKSPKERRLSIRSVEDTRGILGYVGVGCAECHTLDPDAHEDTFLHNGYKVHVVVSPPDCAHCHPAEAEQYRTENKMAHAHGNLDGNPLYHQLVETVTGRWKSEDGSLGRLPSTWATRMDTCYACHGTRVRVLGKKEIETEMEAMEVPELSGWPNMGVGRVNPDGSLGSCSPCHPRHAFSIRVARQPYVCSQCHLEPDAPAWNVYKESKHGNLFASSQDSWNLDAVPWRLGMDFRVPTCATCHASLVVDPEGAVILARTHGYGDRLWTRLFGLIYSHPQPKDPDTRPIRNRDGQPLPVSFDGKLATDFLIDAATQARRERAMKTLCRGCHSTLWVEQHFRKMEASLKDVDKAVRAGTGLIVKAWEDKTLDGTNPFDEAAEIRWTEQWLFFANSIRYASAMAGGPDYAAFHHGWWELSKAIEEIQESIGSRGGPPGKSQR